MTRVKEQTRTLPLGKEHTHYELSRKSSCNRATILQQRLCFFSFLFYILNRRFHFAPNCTGNTAPVYTQLRVVLRRQNVGPFRDQVYISTAHWSPLSYAATFLPQWEWPLLGWPPPPIPISTRLIEWFDQDENDASVMPWPSSRSHHHHHHHDISTQILLSKSPRMEKSSLVLSVVIACWFFSSPGRVCLQ